MSILKRIAHGAPLFIVAGSLVRANSVIAPVTWIGDELNNMVDTHIDLFIAEGQSMLWSIAAILLVWYLLISLFSGSLSRQFLVELILNFMLASMMLTFYDAPMPWGGGISFHEIWSAEANWIAQTLDAAVITNLVTAIQAMASGLTGNAPAAWNLVGVLAYGLTMGNLAIVWLLTSGITLIAHIALGFGAVIGPLLVPFFVWPAMAWLFWGFVRFMTTYALYLVAASAIVYVYAHVMMYFISNVFGGDYSMGHALAMLIPFVTLNGIFLIAFWECHSWARDLASGSASLGGAVSSTVSMVALRVVG